MNITTDKKVTSRADLNGIKLRVPNSELKLYLAESLGANGIPLAWSEVYLALQTGTLDGQDNAVSTIKTNSMQEVTESATITGHILSTLQIFMNGAKYQSMSPELQQIIDEGVAAGCNYVTETSIEQEADDIAFLEEQGLVVYQLTDEELSSYSQEVLDYYLTTNQDIIADIDMDLYNSISEFAQSVE